MEARFSLRYKLLVLVTGLVIGAIGAHLFFATRTFKTDKTKFVFESNQATVKANSSHLDMSLRSAADKLKLFSFIFNGHSHTTEMESFEGILESDPLLASIQLYNYSASHALQPVTSLNQKKFSSLYNLSPSYFKQTLPNQRPIPVFEIQSNNVAVWNATVADGPPLIALGARIEISESGNTKTMMVVGYLRADLFIKELEDAKPTSVVVLTADGNVLMHPDVTLMAASPSFSEYPIVKEAKDKSSGVMKYSFGKKEYLGAFSKVDFGRLIVISSLDSDLAFEIVQKLISHSVLVALIIITFTFIISISYLNTVTNPLMSLVAAMGRVAAGDLTTEFRIDTKDEIGVLSKVFSQMTGDLNSSRNLLEETNRSLEEKVKERTAKLREMAIRDTLTGLYNRRHFNETLLNEIKRSERYKHPVGIVYLDIDHFKKYNDQNGHPAGDSLLKLFSLIVQENVRNTDTFARLGGEEFCVILPETDIEGSLKLAEKLRKAVEANDFAFGDRQPLGRLTCSLGVSVFPIHGSDEEELIKAADQALYRCKEGGRNRVELAETLTQTQKQSG